MKNIDSMLRLYALLDHACDERRKRCQVTTDLVEAMEALDKIADAFRGWFLNALWRQEIEVQDDGSWIIKSPELPQKSIHATGEKLPDIVRIVADIERRYGLTLDDMERFEKG